MVDTGRSNKAKKNIAISLVCEIITLLCGFVVPRAMIGAFGSEVYGATSSITQLLAYIALLEGGVGSVAKAVLYKPLAEHDVNTISAIMTEVRHFFRTVGIAFVAYSLIIACCFKSISNVESLDWLTSFLLVIVISISTFGQYFIGISNSLLLQAAQKSYIYHLVNLIGTILNAAVVVILTANGYNIIIVKLVSSIIFFIKPIVLWLYVKKCYRLPRANKSDCKYLTQKWDCFGQHIAYYLHSNTDVVVLTLFADLKDVAVYTVYNMVISHIKTLAVSFVSGMEALFGDMLVKGEQKLLHRTFGLYETMMSAMSVILFSVTAVMIVPFITIYMNGVGDANYCAPVFAQLLIIAALLYCLRMPYHSMVMAAGHFKQTMLAAYGEVAINVSLSLILVFRYNLVGVAIGTIVATGFRLIYYAIYLSKRILGRKASLFIKRSIVNALTYSAACLLGNCIVSGMNLSNYLEWAACAALVGIVSCAIVGGSNLAFYRDDCCQAIRKLFPNIKWHFVNSN